MIDHNPNYAKTAPDRNNYASMSQLIAGCDAARRILRRKRSTDVDLRRAAAELLKAVRSMRSWLDTAHDQVKWARRCLAIEQGKRIKAERALEESLTQNARTGKVSIR